MNFNDIMASRVIEKARRGEGIRKPPNPSRNKGNTPVKNAVSRRVSKSRSPAQRPNISRPPVPSRSPMMETPQSNIQHFIKKLSPDIANLGKKNGRF
jgi:hypothetical protein